MSRPANPLTRFRSYSYYHVLAICDSSMTADSLAKETNPNKWLHPSSPNDAADGEDAYGALGPYAVKFVDAQAKTGRYCILINGSTDAAFSIARAKWSSITAADATMLDSSTSVAVEGEMEISEPKGVVFLDVLVSCCLALGIDVANAAFVLKTFFVGSPDQDNVPVDEYYITDIEPLRFIAYDVTGSFAETGGLYQLAFVALTHGASRLPQFGKAASGFNITGGTLAQTVANLSAVIKKNYDVLYKCVTRSVNDEKIAALLTEVEYEIRLEDVYQSNVYRITDSSVYVKDKAGRDVESKINVPANSSIEDALHIIMKRCPKVTEEMSDGIEDNDGQLIHYEYKIHSAVESQRGADGKVHYKVIYFIRRFMRPKDGSLFEIAANIEGKDLTQVPEDQLDKLSDVQRRMRKNLISFDYIYTGNNVDILEFDMKMNLGLAYLQIATSTNTLKDQLQAVPTAVSHIPQYDIDKVTRLGGPAQIPVFFGSQIRSTLLRNKQDSSQNAEAGYTLAKHSSVEVQDVTMRIHGNPKLLSTVNRATGPENLGVAPPDQTDDPNHEEADFRDWSSFPSFAKINIKMPRNNDDISLFRGESVTDPEVGGTDFTRDFWFTGFYYVIAIEHFFEEGEFTQQLSMVGIPQTSAFKSVNQDGETAEDFDLQKKVLDCYDSYVDICRDSDSVSSRNKTGAPPRTNQKAGTAVGVPPPPTPAEKNANTDRSKNVKATNLADNQIVARSIDPNSVAGWKTAKPAVRQAITNAANKHGVDVGFMAAIAAKESNFNPDALDTTTGARGLYKFTRNQWLGGGGITAADSIDGQFGPVLGFIGKTNDQIDTTRNDPRTNAEAFALTANYNRGFLSKYVTPESTYNPTGADLYMAHLFGLVSTTALIAAPNQNELVETILGAERYNNIISKAPAYANYKTIKAFRNYNATNFTQAVPGIKVVQANEQVTSSPQQPASQRQRTGTGSENLLTIDVIGGRTAKNKVSANKDCIPRDQTKSKKTNYEVPEQAQDDTTQ